MPRDPALIPIRACAKPSALTQLKVRVRLDSIVGPELDKHFTKGQCQTGYIHRPTRTPFTLSY
jgi:hypothetical protein